MVAPGFLPSMGTRVVWAAPVLRYGIVSSSECELSIWFSEGDRFPESPGPVAGSARYTLPGYLGTYTQEIKYGQDY